MEDVRAALVPWLDSVRSWASVPAEKRGPEPRLEEYLASERLPQLEASRAARAAEEAARVAPARQVNPGLRAALMHLRARRDRRR